MSLIEIKSATITEKGQLAIPKDARNIEGFSVGSKVVILTFDDHIELRPLKFVNEKMETAIASEKTLGKDWNSKEDEDAWNDL